MYVVAGEVAAAAAGTSYEALVRRELFEPLQMSRCQVGEWQRDVVGNVAQPHMREGDGNVIIRKDDETIPVSTSAAAGGIRCSLDDMLKWMRMWLDADSQWLTPAQRQAVWTPHMPIPLSARQRRWDGSRFNAYGYGWRISDVDGVLRVAHTGTLAGMYSAVTLLPERDSGFVFMINGEGSEARIVLNEVLVKLFTAPGERRRVADYAAELARRATAGTAGVEAAGARTKAAHGSDARQAAGIYQDPWFGEVAICERAGAIEFAAAKSPLLSGEVMQAGERLLVDWRDDSIDAEAWLDFSSPQAGAPMRLRLSKVDPEADFSYDYEDLVFTRVGDCSMKSQVDALMQSYSGDVPGASVLVLRDGEPIVRAGYGLANVETHTPATRYDQLPPRIGDEAVHRCVDPAARRGRPPEARRPGAQVAAVTAKGRGAGDDPASADAHLGAHRLRGRHPGNLQAAAARRGCAALAGIAGSHLLPARAAATATATAAMHCWR